MLEQARNAEVTGQDAQGHQPDQHRQTTEGRDDEGAERGATVRLAGVVIADQQVAEDGRELPEGVEHHGVVGGDQAEHGAREGHEQPQAACARGPVREVPAAVEEHQSADAADNHAQHPLQQPHAEVEVDAEHADPGVGLGVDVTPDHEGGLRGEPDEGREGKQCGDEPAALLQPAGQNGCDPSDGEVGHDEGKQHRRFLSVGEVFTLPTGIKPRQDRVPTGGHGASSRRHAPTATSPPRRRAPRATSGSPAGGRPGRGARRAPATGSTG